MLIINSEEINNKNRQLTFISISKLNVSTSRYTSITYNRLVGPHIHETKCLY
jgi:hypothetical protein